MSDRRPDSMERITTKALADAFIEEQVTLVRNQVGDKKVLRRCGKTLLIGNGYEAFQ